MKPYCKVYYKIFLVKLRSFTNKHNKPGTFYIFSFLDCNFYQKNHNSIPPPTNRAVLVLTEKSSETSGNYVVYTVFLMMFLLWIYPQVTPNAGKTSVYQETPITWWAPTVCRCWSTTSEESNSWSVTERERMDPSPSSSAQEEGFAPLYEVLILSTFLWWAESSFPKNILEDGVDGTVVTERSLSYFVWFFFPFFKFGFAFFFTFWCLKTCKK